MQISVNTNLLCLTINNQVIKNFVLENSVALNKYHVMKVSFLIFMVFISCVLMIIALAKINKCYNENKISRANRVTLIYITICVPIVGYFLTRNLHKKLCY